MRKTTAYPRIAWSRTFPATAAQVGEARQFLSAILDDSASADDAVLCLSELVTNAILHTRSREPGGKVTVRVQRSEDRLRVKVHDEGGAWTWPIPDSGEVHGRGLLIVSELSSTWGRVGDAVTGWTVWFELEDSPTLRMPGQVTAVPHHRVELDADRGDFEIARARNREAGQRWTTVLDGDRLRQLRRKRHLTQAELASLAGVSAATVARLERKTRMPCRCRTLTRLAAALEEHPAALAPVTAAVKGSAEPQDCSGQGIN